MRIIDPDGIIDDHETLTKTQKLVIILAAGAIGWLVQTEAEVGLKAVIKHRNKKQDH